MWLIEFPSPYIRYMFHVLFILFIVQYVKVNYVQSSQPISQGYVKCRNLINQFNLHGTKLQCPFLLLFCL